MKIQVRLTDSPKEKPSESALGFGTHFTDHMFVMDYHKDRGWHDPRIIPYGPFEVEPSLMVFHYGQAIFEGMKAYRDAVGCVLTFRPIENIKRLNRSAARICIPQVEEGLAWDALMTLLEIEKAWIPHSEGTSLYIRPFIIATDPFLGVRPSHSYRFFIILSPVAAYYSEGFNPIKIYVTDEYVRAAPGGVGYTKTAGNYAASLYAAEEAKGKGCTQVLWLDAKEHRYVEEVGTMNIFFKIGGTLVTPPLEGGSLLPGITRDSVLTLARDMGCPAAERPITIQEVLDAHQTGILEEIFGTGTAAVISPVGVLRYKDTTIEINQGKTGPCAQKLYDLITGIQYGREQDRHNWIVPV